jgi:tetratricopeptide (TPR) repeat protein
MGLYAVYISSIRYCSEILPPILIVFLFLASLFCLLQFWESENEQKRKLYWLIFSSLFFGLLAVTLTNFMLCLPVILVWILWAFKSHRPAIRIKYAFLFLVISFVFPFAVTIRNTIVAHDAVFISNNGGINFFIGNNPDMKKTVAIRPGIEWLLLLKQPSEQERMLYLGQESRFWFRKSLHFIAHSPLVWLGMTVKKAILFFNAYEFPRIFDLKFFQQYSWVMRLPVARYSMILPLGLGAIFFLCFHFADLRRRPSVVLLMALLFTYASSIILVFLAERYRVPIAPLFVVFSAYFIFTWIEKWIRKEYIGALIMAALAIALTVLTQIQYFKDSYPYTINRAHTYGYIGDALASENEFQEAESYFQEGLRGPIDGSTYELWWYYGLMLEKAGDVDNAILAYEKSVEMSPTNYMALESLGTLYKKKGDCDRAIDFFKKAKAIAPCFASPYIALAECYFLQNKTEEGVSVAESFGEHCPSPNPVINRYLGRIYMDLFRNWKKAGNYLEDAIRYPRGLEVPSETCQRLGSCYYHLGKLDEAEKVWREGLKIDPQNATIRRNIEVLERTRGQKR